MSRGKRNEKKRIREDINVTSLHSFRYTSLVDIESFIKEIKEKVPEDCWTTVEIDYSYDDYWGSQLEVFYYRNETDKEFKIRIANEKEEQKRNLIIDMEKQRREYERLKAKFEGK